MCRGWVTHSKLFQVELVQTACYGVRVYTNTSWLANHVDTRATHAVSVIMQVDQVSTDFGQGGTKMK